MSVEKTVLDNKGGRARVHSRNSLPQALFFSLSWHEQLPAWKHLQSWSEFTLNWLVLPNSIDVPYPQGF